MLEDKRLVWQLKGHSVSALVRIYDKYKRLLLKIAHGIMGDPALAEDVVQDVFVALAESTHRLSVRGSLKGYLVQAVLNRSRNVNRAARIRQAHSGEVVHTQAGFVERPECWMILQDEHRLLYQALDRLPREQREVVTLHLLADLTFREIAQVQQGSINTVQSRYRYGLDKLRSLLCREDDR